MSFIINEEEALKSLLSGITVADAGNASRPVGVFYGQPDKEIRQQSYPYITIDLIGVNEDTTRAHRGYVPLTYPVENNLGIDDTNVADFKTSFPIPVDLMYQVSTWSRQPRHDRQLISALFSPGRLPLRFGQLFIPQDATLRRLDILGFSKRDTTEADKRLFNNVYTIRISAELFPEQIAQVYEVTNAPIISFTYQDTVYTSQTN